jgi:uncharacterized membrane protein
MKIKRILVTTIVIIAFCVYLVFYPLKFDFYDQLKAKKIVDIILIPIVTIIFIRYVVKSAKEGDVNWKTFRKEILFGMVIFGIFYFTILRSVFSCGLLFINCSLKEKEIIEIHGTITDIVNVEGHGKVMGRHELTVKENGNEFVFESNKKAIQNFSVNQEFKVKMKNGILNILYK